MPSCFFILLPFVMFFCLISFCSFWIIFFIILPLVVNNLYLFVFFSRSSHSASTYLQALKFPTLRILYDIFPAGSKTKKFGRNISCEKSWLQMFYDYYASKIWNYGLLIVMSIWYRFYLCKCWFYLEDFTSPTSAQSLY